MLTNNNTTLTVQQIVQQQKLNSIKQYTNYTSKQSLLNSNVLTKTQQQTVQSIKNCFSFSLHNSKQFLIITMYFNSTKSYSYYVLNFTTNNVTIFNSIKQSKQFVKQQITQQQQQTNKTTNK